MVKISNALKLLLHDKNTLRRQTLKKHEMLFRPYGNADEAHYIYSGMCKVYWRNSDNEEMIIGFFSENEIALLPEEFILEPQNRDMYMEALMETVVYTITKAQMKEIYQVHPEATVLTDMIVTKIYRRRKIQILLRIWV
jgi:CRP-like cAMP-binding protein